MLLASNFILNKAQRVKQFKIYPYIHSFSNIVRSDDVLTAAWIPDVNPTEIPRGTDFSMVAGDFLEVYQEEENHGKKKRGSVTRKHTWWESWTQLYRVGRV
jgi:carnosine N-methyltransferase